jgi:hypothetical protein
MEMMSLIYVSKSTIPPDIEENEVEKIVATANYHNPSIDITGALLFTGSKFAQVLEGHASDIDELLLSIRKDHRHRDIVVMDHRPLVARRFPDWSMAYSGPSPFVAGFVTRLLNASSQLEHREATTWLADLMSAFSRK